MPKKYHILILLAIAFLAFSNSLLGERVADDMSMTPESLRATLSNPQKAFSERGYLAYPLSKIFGYGVFPYHLSNVILHMVGVWLVFLVLNRFYEIKPAFWGALLFAVHPIHCDAVSWASGSVHIINGIVVLACLYFYMADKWWRMFPIVLLVMVSADFFFPWSMFLLGLFIIYDLLFRKILIKDYLPLLILVITGIILAWGQVSERLFVTGMKLEGGIALTSAWPARMVYSLTHNFWICLFPVNLTFFHEPMLANYKTLTLMAIGLLASVPVMVWLYRNNKRIFLAISIFVLFLIPTFSPWPVCWVVAERYLWLPVILFSFIVAQLWQSGKGKQVLILILILLTCRTLVRNTDYRTALRFWEKTVESSPLSPRGRLELGKIYIDRKEIAKAIRQFEIGVRLHPKFADAWYSLGFAYWLSGNKDGAVYCWKMARQLNPQNPIYSRLLSEAKNGNLKIEGNNIVAKGDK